MGLIAVITGRSSPPFWAEIAFGLPMGILTFEYGLGLQFLGPLSRWGYADSTESVDLRERRIGFGVGFFGVIVPSLLVTIILLE